MTCIDGLRSLHLAHTLQASIRWKNLVKDVQHGTLHFNRSSHTHFDRFSPERPQHHRPNSRGARDGRTRCSRHPRSYTDYGSTCSATRRGYWLGAGNLPSCICHRLAAVPDTSYPHGTCILAGGGHTAVYGSADQLLQECVHGWWIGFYRCRERSTCSASTLNSIDSYALGSFELAGAGSQRVGLCHRKICLQMRRGTAQRPRDHRR